MMGGARGVVGIGTGAPAKATIAFADDVVNERVEVEQRRAEAQQTGSDEDGDDGRAYQGAHEDREGGQ